MGTMLHTPHLVLILSALLIATTGYLTMTYPLQTAQQQNNGHSGAFYSNTIKDPIRLITQDEIITVTDQTYQFKSPADPTLTIGAISFFFRCTLDCDQLWLSLKVNTSENHLEWLTVPVYVQSLQTPEWFHISDGEYTIFQKPIRHTTIVSVLESTDAESLVVDDHLMKVVPPGITASPLSQLATLSPDMTIITRYQPTRSLQGWHIFEKQLDFSHAEIEHNNYVWKLDQLGSTTRIDMARIQGQKIN